MGRLLCCPGVLQWPFWLLVSRVQDSGLVVAALWLWVRSLRSRISGPLRLIWVINRFLGVGKNCCACLLSWCANVVLGLKPGLVSGTAF